MSIVFILCIPAGGVVLRLVLVLSYVMVEKVKSLLRGHWSAFNIYVLVSSSRLVFLLVVRLVVGVSSLVLSWRLVWRSVSFVSPRVVLAYCSLCISSWCLVPFFRLVFRLVSSSRSHSSRFALVVIRGVRRGGRNVAGMSLSSCGQGRSGFCSRISDWLDGGG